MDGIFEDDTDCKRILREVTLLRKLKHPCVVELVEILMPSDPDTFTTIYVVMEFADSDLKKLLRGNFNLEILHIQTIIYNLLCALKYLHECHVIHRDLKPANILINEDCSVKLCDYGLARSVTGVESAEIHLKEQERENEHEADVEMSDEQMNQKTEEEKK